MRITNSMIRNNTLWSLNKSEELLNTYNTQVSTGKKIQKPSEDPIVAVRALKFRSNISEIKQYKTNSEDADSWLGVTEQAISNSTDLLERARALCVQGSSDTYSVEDRDSIISELEQIKSQLLNEGNVNYAGRYVFSGYKTDTPMVYTSDSNVPYEITQALTDEDMETVERLSNNNITDVNRIRLGYSDLKTTDFSATFAGLTVVQTTSDAIDYSTMADGEAYFLSDTGELVFNDTAKAAINTAMAAAPVDFSYQKTSFEIGDLVPNNYFVCENLNTGEQITQIPDDNMVYQISYNQDIQVNTMGNQVFTADLARDMEEIINAFKGLTETSSEIEKDMIGDYFESMLTKMDDHLNTFSRSRSIIGSKTNRLELTINRLTDDTTNFTELLSLNEDVDMTEAVLNLSAQETIYKAAMMAGAQIMQQSLLDFVR